MLIKFLHAFFPHKIRENVQSIVRYLRLFEIRVEILFLISLWGKKQNP